MPPPYAALLNAKLIVPSNKSNYVAIEQHFLFQCMSDLIGRIYVDEQWYRKTYPDIDDAIKTGILRTAKQHFVRYGYYEHRLPYQIDVDEAWYLKNYPDIEQAIRREQFHSGQDHFEKNGYAEGRLPFPDFVLREEGEEVKIERRPSHSHPKRNSDNRGNGVHV